MRLTSVGVVGAGAMGSGIAALAASAGLKVVLLDIPGTTDRNSPAKSGLLKASKAKPAAFMAASAASNITIGNIEDDLHLLSSCDWIVEAIVELLEPKKQLFANLEKIIKPSTIVTSNTSGIPMAMMIEGRSDSFKKRFLGTHFFNPPRYMHLLELIPTDHTDPAVTNSIRSFAERILGKGTVIAKDVPGFIANRLGIYGMISAMNRMVEHGLSIDEVDGLTGELIGRARTATFRTADLSGLDVLGHVAKGLSLQTGQNLNLPEWVNSLIESGSLGDKTGRGFYKKTADGIFTWDYIKNEYVPQQRISSSDISQLLRLPVTQRIASARDLKGKHGDFLRDHILDVAHYALSNAEEIAFDIVSIDRAMKWGYGWEAGPFEIMDALGHKWLVDEFDRRGDSVPAFLSSSKDTFYDTETFTQFDSLRNTIPIISRKIDLSYYHSQNRTIKDFGTARLIDIGDGVACFEFRSKMNTLGQTLLEGLKTSLDIVGSGKYAGLVIGNDDARTFSAGADLASVSFAVAAGEWKELNNSIHEFQQSVMSIRRAPFPVVVATHGLALGGGTEFTLHADRVQSSAETYMGLVEVGVGVIPGGGGTKELAFRFTKDLEPYSGSDAFEAIKRAFTLIAFATTSTSAHHAHLLGYLREGDRISMNRDHLINDAKHRVLDLAEDYLPPLQGTMRALGRDGYGNLEYALWAAKEAGQASDHDVRVGKSVAYVLCGGDANPREVTEQDLLDLEREQFLSLLGTKETQARIEHMLKTGKPLRN